MAIKRKPDRGRARHLSSFQTAMPVGRADTPASDGLLAAILQAFGDDSYRSKVDAAVSAPRPGLIAELPRSDILDGDARRACWRG
jgi:hypothetical protein